MMLLNLKEKVINVARAETATLGTPVGTQKKPDNTKETTTSSHVLFFCVFQKAL